MAQGSGLEKAVGSFGATAKAKLNQGGQPEDQLRAPLETLFAALAAETGLAAGAMTMIGETSLADLRTRPDYAVQVNKALIGFVEVKAPGKGFDPRKFKDRHDKEQWDRLKALPNLIYTDGNGFSLWRDGKLVGDVVRMNGDVETAGAKLTAPPSLLALIGAFLTWTPIPPRNAKELAVVAARLCRFLRDEVIEQLGVKNARLSELQEDWKALLFPDADDAKFADGYAQAVTFGLLMAKSRKLTLADGLDDVARALGKTNTLIGTALRLLTEQQLSLGPSLDTMVRVLDVVDWDKVAKGDPEAWLYFYEDFLDVYDKRLRRQTGSYYTPPQVVEAMVRLCDEALKSSSRFAVPQGLASNQVHIADPATGSGTFLLAILRDIARQVAADQGEGAVAGAITEAAKRIYGFELQFGAFAVAQLRLLAEMMVFEAEGSPGLFVTDTLSDPYADVETGQGIYRDISRSRREANKIKREQPITVVIGNPPYKEKAKGKGGWIESGGGGRGAPLNDWQPPKTYGRGATANAKHLRNLYVYFWRWASWKVFEQGAGQAEREEKLSGIVCYITVAGFLNGPGFKKMRSDLRRDCDEIWIVHCSPEGLLPPVPTRIFESVKHPVCIVVASRSRKNDPEVPAAVRFCSLKSGAQKEKFEELKSITIAGSGWSDCSRQWRAPFLPEGGASWESYPALDTLLGDQGLGVMPGRTWVIAPDQQSLNDRWRALVTENEPTRRATLFHPHQSGGPTIDRKAKELVGHHRNLASINHEISNGRGTRISMQRAAAYSVRSFDRQLIIPDNRLINRENAKLWQSLGKRQIYLTGLSQTSPTSGPAISLTSNIPDHDHYNGRGGRVFPLWKDAAATQTNVSATALAALSKAYGAAVDPVDLFAYVAALLAHPAYTARFRDDLIQPGLRVPLTADAALFAEAAALGREVIWLHSFGERFGEGRPAGAPRKAGGPSIPKDGRISSAPEDFPDMIDYDAATRRLTIGTGYVDHVAPAVWAYEVSGKQVLRQWFSYRRKTRERPQIGDRRPPSKLGDIQPGHWLADYTAELINVLHVLTLVVELEPAQAALLTRICDGPLITLKTPA